MNDFKFELTLSIPVRDMDEGDYVSHMVHQALELIMHAKARWKLFVIACAVLWPLLAIWATMVYSYQFGCKLIRKALFGGRRV